MRQLQPSSKVEVQPDFLGGFGPAEEQGWRVYPEAYAKLEDV